LNNRDGKERGRQRKKKKGQMLLRDVLLRDVSSYYPDAGLRVFVGFFMMILYGEILLPFVWTFLFEAFRIGFFLFIWLDDDNLETRGSIFFVYPLWLSIGVLASYPFRWTFSLKGPLMFHRDRAKGLFYPLWDLIRNPLEDRNLILWKYHALNWAIFLLAYGNCYVVHRETGEWFNACTDGHLLHRHEVWEISNWLGTAGIIAVFSLFLLYVPPWERNRFPPNKLLSRYRLMLAILIVWFVYLMAIAYLPPYDNSVFCATSFFLAGVVGIFTLWTYIWKNDLGPEYSDQENRSMACDPHWKAFQMFEPVIPSLLLDRSAEEIIKSKET